MAVGNSERLLSSDLTAWYNALNTVIQNYGGGSISTLAVPAANKMTQTVDPNNFFNKLTEMKSDAYLKNASYPSYSVVSSGTLIQSNAGLAMQQGVTYMQSIKCRNTATNASGTCNSGSKSCGANSCGTCSSGNNNSGTHSSGSKGNGTNSCGTKSNAVFDSGNHNVNHNFQSKYNGYVWGFSGFGAFGANGNGTCSSGTCGNVAKSCGTCNSGTNSCTNKSSGTCGSGSNSNGTLIDIFCAHTTKSNG